MQNYFNAFNIFKCGKKLLDRLDVSYERACMATEIKVYFAKILDYLLDNYERHGTPLSSKNIQETVNKVVAGTEEEEKDAKNNVKNITMDTLFQSPVTINPQKKYANVTNERRIAADIHAETMK